MVGVVIGGRARASPVAMEPARTVAKRHTRAAMTGRHDLGEDGKGGLIRRRAAEIQPERSVETSEIHVRHACIAQQRETTRHGAA